MTAGDPANAAPPVILASASRSRRQLLENAGLSIAIEAADLDEAEIKQSLAAEQAPAAEVAAVLAEMKAVKISRKHPGALVIGADQMLDCDGQWFDKPENPAQAKAHLHALAGQTHRLETAACVALDGQRIWHHGDRAELTMRPLSETFIDHYLAEVGEDALLSVGAYQLEGRGAQLFHRVAGDYFTILGLPLLPLLDFLRQHRVIAT